MCDARLAADARAQYHTFTEAMIPRTHACEPVAARPRVPTHSPRTHPCNHPRRLFCCCCLGVAVAIICGIIFGTADDGGTTVTNTTTATVLTAQSGGVSGVQHGQALPHPIVSLTRGHMLRCTGMVRDVHGAPTQAHAPRVMETVA